MKWRWLKWRWLVGLSVLVLVLTAVVAYRVWAVNANPIPGSVWTYFGPTFGADWSVPPTASSCSNIISFGGVKDGVTDNSTAFSAALATATCIYFPSGAYAFSTETIYALSGAATKLTIYGDGSGATRIIHTNAGNGWTFTLNAVGQSVNLTGFSFITTQAGAGNGITLNQTALWANPAILPQSNITDLRIVGSDFITPGLLYWTVGLSITNMSNVNYVNDYFAGNAPSQLGHGVDIIGTGTNAPVEHNFANQSFDALAVGIYYGPNVQGVSVTNSNFVGLARGILINNGGVLQLSVTNSSFNASVGGIDQEGNPFAGLFITGNLFIVQPGSIALSSAKLFGWNAIAGNGFEPATNGSGTGIRIQALGNGPNNARTAITGNSFGQIALGISLPFVAQVTLSGNAFDPLITTPIVPLPIVSTGGTDCGTSPTLAAGSFDDGGTVTVGTSPSNTCTLTFELAYTNPRHCIIQDKTTATLLRPITTVGPPGKLAMVGNFLAGDALSYSCFGN